MGRWSDKPHISPSAMATYFSCGEKYRRRYVVKEKTPPGTGLIRGAALHKAAEVDFVQKVTSHVDLNVSEMQEAAAEHVHSAIKNEGLMLNPEESARGLTIIKGELVDRATALTATFATGVAPRVQPVLVEKWVRIEMPDRTHDLLGRIDVADDQDRIRDIKSSGRRKNADEVLRSDQLSFYHAAFKRETGRSAKSVILDVVLDTKKGGVQTLEADRTAADKQVFLNRLNAMLARVKAGVFSPAPIGSWTCSPKWCEYWATCPYVNSERLAAAESNDFGG